ncbi:MAG TPA: NAD(P)-dependent oxidoreductase [Fimbriimonadaceae bacterium]|nr:NAD(P)-dependent oxidoreductase [Fimbriimonadaceae bacterium]
MRILITGHRGFVGRAFLRMLAPLMSGPNAAEVIGVDIVEGTDCRDFFKTCHDRFDLVIHLAAIIGGRLLIDGKPLSVADDLSIDAEMFQWALRTRPGNLVYFSSSAAYPVEKQMSPHSGLVESDIDLGRIANPDMTYGWVKLTGEYLASFAKEAGIKVFVFRPFSGYGADQDLDYPFPAFIKRAIERQDPFEIWGDGTQTRDFIHVDDIVRAVWAVVTDPADDIFRDCNPCNLCTGRETSFNELAKLVTRTVGYEPEIRHLRNMPQGVRYRHGNPERMLRFFKPRISLEEGIRQAIQSKRIRGSE